MILHTHKFVSLIFYFDRCYVFIESGLLFNPVIVEVLSKSHCTNRSVFSTAPQQYVLQGKLLCYLKLKSLKRLIPCVTFTFLHKLLSDDDKNNVVIISIYKYRWEYFSSYVKDKIVFVLFDVPVTLNVCYWCHTFVWMVQKQILGIYLQNNTH